jgi:L-ornithine Nalpha-acyltransferase
MQTLDKMPAIKSAPKSSMLSLVSGGVLSLIHPKTWGGADKVWFPDTPNQTSDVDGLSTVLASLGPLEVRLARTPKQMRRAQRLRYQVFFEEMSATPSASARVLRRDADLYDTFCDHLLVIDRSSTRVRYGYVQPEVVGTYRLLRHERAMLAGGFYTQNEFNIAPMLEAHKGLRFLELGRSCVVASHRNKRTMELLWQGIWNYVRHHKADVMFGCASLSGTDVDKLALPLSFLHHTNQTPEEWRVSAHAHCATPMNRMPLEAIDPKQALKALPPLVKGYLRLGAYIGNDAVIDNAFGTTDVLVVMPTNRIAERYLNYFN